VNQALHPIVEEFLRDWVWPCAPGTAGAQFRLKLTEEKCVGPWDAMVKATVAQIGRDEAGDSNEWKRRMALEGYAAEGVQFSIKQMTAQLISIDLKRQAEWIDVQRMRARQVWDECKHSKLHVDVLQGHGWLRDERELMDEPDANFQALPAYFGQGMMFAHLHPLARNAQHYFIEAGAYLTIRVYEEYSRDMLVRHENLSQKGEELMHFIEGKYQIDVYCGTPEIQRLIGETLDWVIHFFQDRV
jgi:hypothetical protein